MKVQLSNQEFEYDETLEYYDFYLENGEGQMVKVQPEVLIGELTKGPIQDDLRTYLRYLARWVVEAPRKRFYRDQIRSGIKVLSTEFFFEEDGGERYINNLENSGKFAQALLKLYDIPMPEAITNTNPFVPADIKGLYD